MFSIRMVQSDPISGVRRWLRSVCLPLGSGIPWAVPIPPPPVNNTSYAGCAPYVYTTYNEVNQHPIDSRWPTLPRAWRKDLDMRMLNHVFGEGPTCFHNQRSLSRVLKSAVLSCDWIWLDVIDKFGIHQMGYHNNTFGLNSQTVKF